MTFGRPRRARALFTPFALAAALGASPALAQDEIFEVDFNPPGNRVVVFARNANGDVAPVRSFTSIFFAAPDGVALDAVHGELFLSDQGPSVLMFPRGTSGSVYPSRFIYGALTLLSAPYSTTFSLSLNTL
jgi:hypothetical protein